MAYIANVYQGNHVAATDLQNIENNFEYLRTNFNAPGQPADPGGGLEGVVWWDSDVETLKIRDSAQWRGVFSGTASFKIWAYFSSGAIPDGWSRDAGVSDEVLAFEGGAVYLTGGQRDKGNWNVGSGVTNHTAHNHQWKKYDAGQVKGERDRTWDVNGVAEIAIDQAGNRNEEQGLVVRAQGATENVTKDDFYTKDSSLSAHGSTGSWRVKAAVGIMLYPKM